MSETSCRPFSGSGLGFSLLLLLLLLSSQATTRFLSRPFELGTQDSANSIPVAIIKLFCLITHLGLCESCSSAFIKSRRKFLVIDSALVLKLGSQSSLTSLSVWFWLDALSREVVVEKCSRHADCPASEQHEHAIAAVIAAPMKNPITPSENGAKRSN